MLPCWIFVLISWVRPDELVGTSIFPCCSRKIYLRGLALEVWLFYLRLILYLQHSLGYIPRVLELLEKFLILRSRLRPEFHSDLLRQIFRPGNCKKNSRWSNAFEFRRSLRLISCFLSCRLQICYSSSLSPFEWRNRPILEFLIFLFVEKQRQKDLYQFMLTVKLEGSALLVNVNKNRCSLKTIHLGVNWYTLLSK